MNLFTRTFSKIFRSSNQQELDRLKNIVLAINNKEDEIKSLSESDFKEKTENLKKNVQNGSIEINKRADLIAFEIKDRNPFDSIIFREGKNISFKMIDGKIKKFQ